MRWALLAALIPGWNTRLQALVPPVIEARVSPSRKPPTKIFTLDDYVRHRVLEPREADAIRKGVGELREGAAALEI